METLFEDKKLWITCLILLGGTFLLLTGYQVVGQITAPPLYAVTEDMERKQTVEKYETPEEVVEYVLYWICQGDLDFALRGCAIEEVASNFMLQNYCEILDVFPYTDLLAPADYESAAYVELNKVRMQSIYSDMAEQCIGIFGEGYEVEVLSIFSSIPEDADGFYYQAIRDICAITGAREACNVKARIKIDGIPREMTVTAGLFGSRWKVIQFSEYANYQYVEPQISEYAEADDHTELPIMWEEMSGQILPSNTVILADNSEDEIEKLVNRWFLYVRRGDTRRAMSYFDIYDTSEGLYPDSVFFGEQDKAAVRMQKFYYDMFLYNKDSLNWINQNVKEEAVTLVSLLDMDNLLYVEPLKVEITEQGEAHAKCKVSYRYARKGLSCTLNLTYRDGVGWKIAGIE